MQHSNNVSKKPLPKGARKVFKGILFDVHHWDQEMFDGSSKTMEVLTSRSVVDIIAIVGDKIIVLDQEQPHRSMFCCIPGGHVEDDELPVESAKRELLEETGYESASSDFTIFSESFGSSKIAVHESIYLARNCKKVASQKLDPGEKITVKFVEFDDFLQLCRDRNFSTASELKRLMYEALLDKRKKKEMKNRIFGSKK